MRFLPIIFWVLALLMLIGEFVNPGSGWWVGAAVFAALGVLLVFLNVVRTGKPFTDSAAGH